MSPYPRAQAPEVSIVEATPDQEPILANLLELYVHDFSEFHDVEIGADGRFGYDALPLYWREAARHPFLIRVGKNLAGFALVKQEIEISETETVWDMAEFFVLRGFRRQGVGRAAAYAVWRSFPGQWEVRVMDANQAAWRFWERAIAEFAGAKTKTEAVKKDDRLWHVFMFESAEQ